MMFAKKKKKKKKKKIPNNAEKKYFAFFLSPYSLNSLRISSTPVALCQTKLITVNN